MNILRFPLVAWLGGTVVVADRDCTQWQNCLRETKEFAERLCEVHVRIYSCPYGAKAEGFCCKKKVLGCCRAVLLPEWVPQ